MNGRQLLGAALAGTAIVVCGGKVIQEPPGHAAADGAFVGADGGLVIEPGSGCNGYDAASLTPIGAACRATDDCAAWVPTAVPAGYPISALCHDGACLVGDQLSSDQQPLINCILGSDGNAFCSAYYTQFVLGGGIATSICQQTSNGTVCVRPSCNGINDVPGFDMCVVRGDASAAEPPCRPVN